MEESIVSVIGKLSVVWAALNRVAGQEYGLSPLQAQILEYVDTSTGNRSGISAISAVIGVSKPTVSGAVGVLEKKRLISKHRSGGDRRRRDLALTPAGLKMVESLSQWKQKVEEELSAFSREERARARTLLIQLIDRLQQIGMINLARICPTCENFVATGESEEDDTHYCRLLRRTISYAEMNEHCNEYVSKQNVIAPGGKAWH